MSICSEIKKKFFYETVSKRDILFLNSKLFYTCKNNYCHFNDRVFNEFHSFILSRNKIKSLSFFFFLLSITLDIQLKLI